MLGLLVLRYLILIIYQMDTFLGVPSIIYQ